MGQNNALKNLSPGAVKRANCIENRLAYIFGKISLKKRISAVTATTWSMNFIHTGPVKLITVLIINVERITMATFTKLLVIRIIASNRSGNCNKLNTMLLSLLRLPSIREISAGVNEK